MGKTLLCLVPSRLSDLEAKGVTGHITERDLGGYWERVYTVHPFCLSERRVELSERHTVLEYRFGLRMLVSLARLIKREKIDAIKAHDPYCTGAIALALSFLCHIPYVIMICSSYDLMYQTTGKSILVFRWLDSLVSAVTLRFAAMVFGGSEDAMRWAIKNGAKESTACVVRTGGVDAIHYAQTEPWSDIKASKGLSGKRVILYIGRLDPVKFPDDAVKCFAEVSKSEPGAVLVMAGEGDMRDEVEKLVSHLGLADKVRFLGFIPQRELYDWTHSADVIVAPLSGSALVESALSGTAVVAYDIDWHSELIVNGETGILVKYRDCKAMAEAVLWLLADDGLRHELGMCARQRALEQHGLENVYRTEASCFDRLSVGTKTKIVAK